MDTFVSTVGRYLLNAPKDMRTNRSGWGWEPERGVQRKEQNQGKH